MQIRETAYEGIKKAVRESPWYDAHAGVYPALLGVYSVNVLSKQPSGLVITNPSFPGQKKKVRQVKTVVEEGLVYPFVRGRDVKRWYIVGEYGWIVVPHNPTTGKPLDVATLKTQYPTTFSYFSRFKEELEERPIHKLWGSGNPFYSLYDIGPYTYFPYKVVWKRVAGRISGKAEFSAAVMEEVDDKFVGLKPIIPYEKLMLIPLKNVKEAHYVTAVLNSSIIQTVVASYLVEQSISDVTKRINIPKFDSEDALHLALSDLSQSAHKLARKYYEEKAEDALEKLRKVQDQVDEACASLYGVSDGELVEIRKTLQILREGEGEDQEESSVDH
jgi:hypothetical protein